MNGPNRVFVALTNEEMLAANNLESLVCNELRRHNIPVIGQFRYQGVRTGVLRVKRTTTGAEFTWWASAKLALDEGVIVPDSPKSEALNEPSADTTIAIDTRIN